MSAWYFSFGKLLEENSCGWLFQPLELHFFHSLVIAPCSSFKAGSLASSNLSASSSHHFLLFCLCCQVSVCLPLMRTIVITFRVYTGNTEKSLHLKVLNIITSIHFLLSYVLTCTGSGVRTWTSWGSHYSGYHIHWKTVRIWACPWFPYLSPKGA